MQDACFGDKLSNYQKRFGGYWRFQDLKDFCYLENPKFPPKEMIEKINSFSKDLITKYPSNKEIQSLTATSVFDVKQEEIVVGNGSAELIKELGKILSGKLILNIPVFNEYTSCFDEKNIIKNNTEENDYLYNKETIIKNMKNTKIIALINPDNPSGNFIEYNDMLEILEKAKEKSIKVIFDESFIDFADKEKRYTLIKHSILEKYPNLIVIKSISKSYGVPGLRLGVLASGNKEIVQKIKENLEIWNDEPQTPADSVLFVVYVVSIFHFVCFYLSFLQYVSRFVRRLDPRTFILEHLFNSTDTAKFHYIECFLCIIYLQYFDGSFVFFHFQHCLLNFVTQPDAYPCQDEQVKDEREEFIHSQPEDYVTPAE